VAWLLTATELGMLAYWVAVIADAVGLIAIPPEWMYSDHANPLVVAWNWSFLPIDVLFAVAGLFARFGGLAAPRAEALSLVALTLMMCAGLMAIAFWAMRGEFDAFWWGLNLWLLGLGLVGLLRRLARA
jgi:hypothetical protein